MNNQPQLAGFTGEDCRIYQANIPVELTVTAWGYEHYVPGRNSDFPGGDVFTLLGVARGQGICTLGEKVWELTDQDMVLVHPGKGYTLSAQAEEGCTWMWITVSGIHGEGCMLRAGFLPERPCRRTRCGPQLEQMFFPLRQIQPDLAWQVQFQGRFLVLLGKLMEEYAGQLRQEPEDTLQQPRSSSYVRTAVEYLSRHYPENIKIKDLADLVGINRSYFASSFKKATGYSPKEYLLGLRMEKAQSLLEITEMPISSISAAVGYEDPLAFSRIFKRYSGQSPTDYRAHHRSGPDTDHP